MIYPDKQRYTIFIANFLQHGIAYLFLAARSAIAGEGPPEADLELIKRIKINYVQRYNL